MKFLIINGPNLNLLGRREPGIYGKSSYADLCTLIEKYARDHGSTVRCFQSNHEGAIIDEIHAANGVYDAIVINPGAYTHYSYAILDALKADDVPAYDVHISHIDQREPFRAVSVTAPACVGQIYGLGFDGYLRAMDYFLGASSAQACPPAVRHRGPDSPLSVSPHPGSHARRSGGAGHLHRPTGHTGGIACFFGAGARRGVYRLQRHHAPQAGPGGAGGRAGRQRPAGRISQHGLPPRRTAGGLQHRRGGADSRTGRAWDSSARPAG